MTTRPETPRDLDPSALCGMVSAMTAARSLLSGVEVHAPRIPRDEEILTPEAISFVAELSRTFDARVDELLAQRRVRRGRVAKGERFDFLKSTLAVREASWAVAPLPPDLLDRRVEITGPVDRKMIINGLNSGANVFMADFEDSCSPTWENLVQGQVNLFDAVRGTITFHAGPKSYALAKKTAVLMVRPRGLHLHEAHVLVNDTAIRASFFDFGLFFFHDAKALLERGKRPYFYLPKLESHLEARLWNDVFIHSQQELGVPRGTIKATCLVETLPAAFEMDEILYELREHAAGLNCGRWDYIFSYVKNLAHDAAAILPDRNQVTMDKAFLEAYSQLLIKTCHRRNVHAMGGMAAQVPIKNDPRANEAALAKVRADKLREVTQGHDGTWVAHPALVAIAREVFDRHMPGHNQIENTRDEVVVTTDDLYRPPAGTRTEEGLRHNVRVGVQYLEAWLGGNGCVPLYNLMEDAATAEISRAQVWQWLHHEAEVDGRALTRARFFEVLSEELQKLRREIGETRFTEGRFESARELFERMCVAPTFEDFLTIPAYEKLIGASPT